MHDVDGREHSPPAMAGGELPPRGMAARELLGHRGAAATRSSVAAGPDADRHGGELPAARVLLAAVWPDLSVCWTGVAGMAAGS